MDQQNNTVKSFLASYHNRSNHTFTWYDNGTLAYRYPNGKSVDNRYLEPDQK